MDLASFLKKDTLDFPYIYQWGKKIRKRRGKIYYPCLTLENDFSYIYQWKKNSKKRQREKIYHPCRRKTSMEQKKFDRKERVGTIFHIFIDRKKFERGRGRIYHLSLFYLGEWFFIYLSMGKKSKKRQTGKIYHPCRRKTPWRTIFHIFIV